MILRHGGLRLHRRVAPLFLGLILGDYVIGSIWAIIGPVSGLRTYKIFILAYLRDAIYNTLQPFCPIIKLTLIYHLSKNRDSTSLK